MRNFSKRTSNRDADATTNPAAGVGSAHAPPDDDTAGDLSFPDLPKTRLEAGIEQLTQQAHDVLRAQGRLRQLLRANALVAGEISLPVVLRRIVEAARDLIGTRFAALGVIGWDGQLEQFIHVGMDDETVAAIGPLPRGSGILGLLINDPRPLRLADLTNHPKSVGFPANHPMMRSFLGVPIRVGSEVFGNLYLTEKLPAGEFTEEDEQLLSALAAAAGAAIGNSRLFAESEQRRRWQTAASELAHEALRVSPDMPPYDLIVKKAMDAGGADFGAVLVPIADRELIARAAEGLSAERVKGLVISMDGSIAGEVMDSGKPRLITDYGATPGSLPLDAAIGPVAVIPLTVGEDIRGVVHLGRLRDHPALTSFDVDMAASFATQASITLELIDARSDQMNLARLEDHDRIARDLHDHVIQELFAVGMSIQSLVGVVSNEAHAERLTKQVDSLDRAIARIRASIFELRHDQDRPHGIAIRLENVIGEHQSQLGFAPTYELVGLERSDDLEPLADDLEAVLREGLSNCARHAAATSARIVVARQGEVVLVEIADNGDGIRKTDRLSGLQNLRDRAERHGGSMSLSRAEGGGTHLVWTAHLS